MIDRRRLLIEMHRAGIATPERLRSARAMTDVRLPAEVMSWDPPAPVLEAAGIPVSEQTGKMGPKAMRQRISNHLALIGREPMPVERLPWWTANGRGADPEWEELLGPEAADWAIGPYGAKSARIMFRRDDPAWTPLAEVVAGGFAPIGPVGDVFIVGTPVEG